MMTSCKDPVKIVYLDVSFQGEDNGRLALRSRSMTFFSALGERKGNVAWNSIVKVQTGAVKNATEEKFMLKILNNAHQSLTFEMKDEAELDKIRSDIQDAIKNYKDLALLDPDEKPSAAGSVEDSLTNFPRFVDEDESTRSAMTRNTASVVQGSNRSIATHSMVASTRSMFSRLTHSSPGQHTHHPRDDGSLAYSQQPHSLKGDVMVEEDMDASTIASTAAGSVAGDSTITGMRDVEVGTVCTKSHRSLPPTKTFNNDTYAAPVATFRLVPEEKPASLMYGYYPHQEAEPRKRKFCRSKWLLLALLLIGLLLIGMAIGMGIMSSKNKKLEAQTTAIIGQEDTTVMADEGPTDIGSESPTAAPSLNEFVAAMERTNAPTQAPSIPLPTLAPTIDECKKVGHATTMNSRADAYSAGAFGGSSYCRANIMALCQWTEWLPFNTFQGVGSAWFKATALEDSFCVADIEHQVQLHVPEGVDYDLHVYKTTAIAPHDSSTVAGSNGNIEAVIVTGDDVHLSDQTFSYQIHVQWKSGSSCEPWTVEFYGHKCL